MNVHPFCATETPYLSCLVRSPASAASPAALVSREGAANGDDLVLPLEVTATWGESHIVKSADAEPGEVKALLPRHLARGIVYYFEDNTIVGALTWNAPDCTDKVRDVIRLQPHVASINGLSSLVPLAPANWLSFIETDPARV